MLKAELHTHVKGDPEDNISHSVYDLIDEAKKKNYQVLGITCHNYLFSDQKAKLYARKRGIILFYGIEKNIDGKHTLVYNCSKEIESINTINELKNFKEQYPEILVIAAHPFHSKSSCHGNNVIEHKDLFDAWEYSFFYTNWFNPNKKTLRLAKKLNKPLVGNCDVHNLTHFGSTYSIIDSLLEEEAILKAIKSGKIRVFSKPLSSVECGKIIFKMIISRFKPS